MKIPKNVRSGWEHRFPDLSGEWTHWKILGDGDYIDIVDGLDLIKALEIVEDNFGKFGSIKACRAKIDENNNIIDEEKSLFEISNFFFDERSILSAKK